MNIHAVNQNILVAIKNLSYSFGNGDLSNKVLDDINLTISKGKMIILTGPSGSGKTTLLTLIGSLRSTQTGSISVLGDELVRADNRTVLALRQKIGFIFQSHNLIPSLTAAQNVAMTLELNQALSNGERIKESCLLLKKLGLGERLNYYPENLSGGQCQRVAIARALVGNPQLILADEPTASLDSESGQTVMNFLKKQCRDHKCSAVIVTHDPRIAHFADHVINLEDGRITSDKITID